MMNRDSFVGQAEVLMGTREVCHYSTERIMSPRNSPEALKQGLSLETMLYKQQIAIPLWKEVNLYNLT